VRLEPVSVNGACEGRIGLRQDAWQARLERLTRELPTLAEMFQKFQQKQGHLLCNGAKTQSCDYFSKRFEFLLDKVFGFPYLVGQWRSAIFPIARTESGRTS
jgi:hypothetical protein